MPDDMLGRINAALEDWEHGPDAARWRPGGTLGWPADLSLPEGTEWVALCAPGCRVGTALILGVLCDGAGNVTDVRESPLIEGREIVLVNTATLDWLARPVPVTFSESAAPPWRFDYAVRRPRPLLSLRECLPFGASL
jgi:hypothetical protein